MTPDDFLAILGFAFVSTVTPGPNNVMLTASGANFGVRRTLPHMAGISIGFPLMMALVGLGVMRLFDLWPPSYPILKAVSLGYLLYLAWRIATAAPPGSGPSRARPLSLVQAAAFQWVNPKAWAMALSAVTLYAPERDPGAVFIVTAIFALVSIPSVTIWAALGSQLRGLLSNRSRLRLFNGFMATVLVISMAPGLLR